MEASAAAWQAAAEEAAASAQAGKTVWNPFTARDKCSRQHTREALKRIKSDIKQLVKAPLPGIMVWVDEKDMSMVHVLVNGPYDTPYEGGFFYFLAWCLTSSYIVSHHHT